VSCKQYEPLEQRIEDDFVLSITDSTGVVNDGRSTVKVKFENTKEVKEGLKVTFTTTKGTFLVNDLRFGNHKAETTLKVDSDTGIYIIKAQLKEGDVVKVEKIVTMNLRPAYNNNDFVVNVSDTTGVRADGRAVFTVRLSNIKEVKDGLKVSFQSNKGSFLFNDIKFENHKAEAFLKVDQDTGVYVIKALLKEGEVVKVEKILLVSFRRAYPDSIAFDVNRTLYSLTSPTTITTYLFRNIGLVTKGTSVFFRAFQVTPTNDTLSVGRFEGLLNNYSDVNGKLADIKLYTDGSLIDTNRVITIQAKAINDRADTIKRNYTIRYK
jgi:hypothetical protein